MIGGAYYWPKTWMVAGKKRWDLWRLEVMDIEAVWSLRLEAREHEELSTGIEYPEWPIE